jgi:hypothetical protein
MARELTESWFAAQCRGAPPALVERAAEFARQSGAEGRVNPESLARAGATALQRAIVGSHDREGALDLLAADALVTLALAAQVERDPTRLAAFAGSLLVAEPGPG